VELPHPLWQQLLVFAVAPLVGAIILRQMIRGWAHLIQGEELSEQTKDRQRDEIWSFLVVMYPTALVIFVLAHVWKR